MASFDVVVAGRRSSYTDAEVFGGLDAWVSTYGPIRCVVHGACPDPARARDGLSADACAERWARARGLDYMRFPVPPEQWAELGAAAGPLRNGRMGDHLLVEQLQGRAVAVLAFPGGRGTRSMVAEARARRLPVFLADVDAGTWSLADPVVEPPTVVQGAVSVRVETAVGLLRGQVRGLGPLGLPPAGQADCDDAERMPIEPGQAIALHCRRREVAGGGRSAVERRLRWLLRGKIFAVARVEQLGAIEHLWAIPAVEDRGFPKPWRLEPIAGSAVIGSLGRLRRRLLDLEAQAQPVEHDASEGSEGDAA